QVRGAVLEQGDREWVAELAVRDAVAGRRDSFRLLPIEQAEVGIHSRGRSLDAAEPARDRNRDWLAGDREVLDSLTGFRAPQLLRRGRHALESRRRAACAPAARAG